MAVFYSFHYERAAWRVQQVMQMGVVEGQPLLNSQEWEAVRRQGARAIKNWIDGHMKYKSAVVVLTAARSTTPQAGTAKLSTATSRPTSSTGCRTPTGDHDAPPHEQVIVASAQSAWS